MFYTWGMWVDQVQGTVLYPSIQGQEPSFPFRIVFCIEEEPSGSHGVGSRKWCFITQSSQIPCKHFLISCDQQQLLSICCKYYFGCCSEELSVLISSAAVSVCASGNTISQHPHCAKLINQPKVIILPVHSPFIFKTFQYLCRK